MQVAVLGAGRSPAMMKSLPGPWLWVADIAPAKEAAWAARHAAWLSSSEHARLTRISRAERRAQMLAGHVLLRRLVAASSDVPADAVAIASDAEGRPAVEFPKGWRASLAHSGRWVVALLDAGDAASGVDIEFRQTRRDIQTIVKAACGVDVASRDHAYSVWAQREAEFKAGPGSADVWVATWDDHALAVCARAAPVTATLDLAGDGAARRLAMMWTTRPRLPVAAWAQ